MAKQKRIRVHPMTIFNNLTVNRIYGRLAKESQYLQSLHYNLRIVGWDDFPIFPDGFAGNASLLYFIFKFLYREKPKSVLEIGSGQSSLLTSRYIKSNSEANVTILEENEDWYKRVDSMISNGDNVRLIHSPLESVKVKRRKKMWYSTKIFDTEDAKYDLIIIDGPVGTYRLSRAGICNHLPKIIDKGNFVIIFDDSTRKGEIDTIKHTKRIFRSNKIEFMQFHIHGTKKQTCLVSPNKAYLAFEWSLY